MSACIDLRVRLARAYGEIKYWLYWFPIPTPDHWLLLHFNASPLKERVRTPTWEEVTQTFIAKPPTKKLHKQHALLPTSPEKGSLPALQKQVSARCKAQHIGVRGSYSPKLDVFAASGKHDRRESTVKKKARCEERLPQLTRHTKMDQSSSVVSLPSVFKERPPIDASSMEELDEFWSSIA